MAFSVRRSPRIRAKPDIVSSVNFTTPPSKSRKRLFATESIPCLSSEDFALNDGGVDVKEEEGKRQHGGGKKSPGEKVTSTVQETKAERSPAAKKERVTDKPELCSQVVNAINTQNEWIDLQVLPVELRPSATLTTGQSFVWQAVRVDHALPYCVKSEALQEVTDDNSTEIKSDIISAWGTHDAKEWIGVIGQRVISIKETLATTMVRIIHDNNISKENDVDKIREEFKSYFQLEVPLRPLYEEWSTADDKRLPRIANVIPGARVLRQDPVECLFSFICSSNNNIPRITLMLSRLRAQYGTKLLEIPIRKGHRDSDESEYLSF
jgi:hypothetical protein